MSHWYWVLEQGVSEPGTQEGTLMKNFLLTRTLYHDHLSFPKVRCTNKHVFKCLGGNVDDSVSDTPPFFDDIILNGAFIVLSPRPDRPLTLIQNYVDQVFLTYVMSWLNGVSHSDRVRKFYKNDSLKSSP
ncbi:hypothetical protein ElyMa_004348900 [Elysia marginata]|uniref:Uncharacterized protein n=1 Tax=Elysia marginata TaxID=1093978 RepID=A0AAV4H261_9GAST|nr:hypothetical protein ElyMa_004348900 [Elysia marginata]